MAASQNALVRRAHTHMVFASGSIIKRMEYADACDVAFPPRGTAYKSFKRATREINDPLRIRARTISHNTTLGSARSHTNTVLCTLWTGSTHLPETRSQQHPPLWRLWAHVVTNARRRPCEAFWPLKTTSWTRSRKYYVALQPSGGVSPRHHRRNRSYVITHT